MRLAPPLREKVFDHLALMNGRSIPDHQQVAGDLAREHLQKAHDIWAFVGMVLALKKQPALWGNSSNHREMVTGQFDSQDGRLASWGIRSDCHG